MDLDKEPKTPTKSRPNVNADDLRFIVSEEKPMKLGLWDSIFADTLENNLLFLSKEKEDPSEDEQYSDSYISVESSKHSQTSHPEEQEKFQTVKKLFEPKLAQKEQKYLTTARANTKGCNCGKSKCQKNYCVCFKMGNTCSGDCECVDCENHSITSEHLKNEKIALELLSNSKQKGCNCKNSNCLKNYCICHQFGQKCSEMCKCENCYNMGDEEKDEFGRENGGVRLMFTARKKVKVTEFGYGKDKENVDLNKVM